MSEVSRDDLSRQIGRVEGLVEGLVRDQQRHFEASEKLEMKVDQMQSTIDRAKGG
jgi:TolA-binding protein